MKVAILIPTTTNNRRWNTYKDTYLYTIMLHSFLETYTTRYDSAPLDTVFYFGYDNDDAIWGNEKERGNIIRFLSVMKCVRCHFVSMTGIQRGYLTKMWNCLFQQAYDDGCDYFFQCGDDITFHTKGWMADCIFVLQQHDNIGLAGPMNNNARILTQAMVSRTHMEIFGFFFPEEIVNWCCDDWYNFVYQPAFFYPLVHHLCTNDGGAERYDINHDPSFKQENAQRKIQTLRKETIELAEVHRKRLGRYLHQRLNCDGAKTNRNEKIIEK